MASDPHPTFSIVVAVLNGARTIQRCLDSVRAQTYPSLELIVMDGGSTDGTQTVLQRYDRHIAFWDSSRDRGICHAWNKALDRAEGEWITFLGADDVFASADVLERARHHLAGRPPPSVVYGQVRVVTPNGREVAVQGGPWHELRAAFLEANVLPHQGVFHHRSLFERHGKFDEGFRICGDYELLLRELKQADPAYIPDLVVVEMAHGGLSTRASNAYRATREQHRARHRHGLARFPEWLSFRVLRASAFELIRRTLGVGAARSAADRYQALTRGLRRP